MVLFHWFHFGEYSPKWFSLESASLCKLAFFYKLPASFMPRSLLSRLPDIFASAAVRSSEALHALGLGPGQRACCVITVAEDCAAPRWRFHPSSDMSALLGLLAGQAPFPSMRQQLGLLWLSTGPAPGATPDPETQQVSLRRDASLLSDFSQRLLMARELLSPSALVVVEPAAGMEECIALVMQIIFGHRPQWTKIDDSPDAPQVLMCAFSATDSKWPTSRHQGHRAWPNLTQWLRDAPIENRTALALCPGLDLTKVWGSWGGSWVVTHPDSWAFGQLRDQAARELDS
jgi:hypothetical protein